MWKELHSKSNGLVGPYLTGKIKDWPLSFRDIASALDGAKKNFHENINYFRGYIDGKEDYLLAEKFLNLNLSSENIESTILNAFGGDNPEFGHRSGLIVNGILQWSGSLQKSLHSSSKEISKLYLDQHVIIDVTLFIGAYGSTPFGVHIDDSSHRTILFNLGEGEKGIAIWENDAIREQFGKVRNVIDRSLIKGKCKEFYFRKGEAFVLPSSKFHIGLNDTCSTTIAVVVDIVPEDKAVSIEAQILGRSIKFISQKKKKFIRELLFTDFSLLNKMRSLSNNNLKYSMPLKEISIERIGLEIKVKFTKVYMLKVFSNNGMSIVYFRGYHHIYDGYIKESFLDSLIENEGVRIKEIFNLLPSENNIKEKIYLLEFFLKSGFFEEVL